MLVTAIYSYLYLAVILIILVSGYIVKKHIIKILEESGSLKSGQIKSWNIIINTIFYTVTAIVLLMNFLPYIINLIIY